MWKRGTALVPSFTAFAVVGLLEDHFANLVDYGFTASMEDDLDDIASGSEEQVPWLERFYFGEHRPGAAQPGRASGPLARGRRDPRPQRGRLVASRRDRCPGSELDLTGDRCARA